MFAATAALTGAAAAQEQLQIEQVIGGIEGVPTAQAIQLRMRHNNQGGVSAMRIRAWDATGSNPIVVVDFTTNVPNGTLGNRVLVATSNFTQVTNPAVVRDFTITNVIPPSYLPAGSLTYESDAGVVAWRLSWGGAAYTGPHNGSVVNDPDGNFGPAWPGPLPSSSLQSLRYLGNTVDGSTSNAADYALSQGAAVLTNNGGGSTTVSGWPFGACCFTDGSCSGSFNGGFCEKIGGTYMGDSSICATANCPQPTGACCHTNGTCTLITQSACGTAGGTYLGNGQPCAGCAPPCPSDCATPHDNRVNVVDLLALLAQWGTPGACNTDGDALVDVGDLLALLADWGDC
jgi:hypothetical protein